ncbi:MAG TPA: hypothetical protein VHA37_05155, partial [Candidatus Saccharimonadales bacterium]|nr:hypothetical protein [Candidatus Saccharimonadales bacterium]
ELAPSPETRSLGNAPETAEPGLAVPVLEIPRGFDVHEVAVLSLISRGNTAVQVARLLGPEFDLGRSDVYEYRDSAMDKLGTKSVAQAVHRAIKRDIVPVEVQPEETVLAGLRDHDSYTLHQYARGLSNQQLAHASGQPLGALEAYHDRLLYRLGAWSRPHAIRRGHELGILR